MVPCVPRTLLALSLFGVAVASQAYELGHQAANDRTRIVNEGGIRDRWMLADGVQLALPGYPVQLQERGDSVCVAIGYSIDPKTGATGDFSLLKEWSNVGDASRAKGYYDPYVNSAAHALSQWKFKPRPEVEHPERTVTVATMIFSGKDKPDPAALRANCKITDLAGFIQQAANKNLNRDDTLRLQQQQRWDKEKSMQALRPPSPYRP